MTYKTMYTYANKQLYKNSYYFFFQIGLNVIYNYVDFAIKPLLEIYDISTCYPEAEKVKFQVKFQG